MQEQSILPLTGFLITFVIDLINRNVKNSDTRRAIAYVFCSVWGVAINVIEHNADYSGYTLSDVFVSVLVSIGTVIGFSQLTYKGIPGTDVNWEDSNIRTELQLNAKKV